MTTIQTNQKQSNTSYWQGRVAKENDRNYKRTVRQTNKELIKLYHQQANQLEAEISRIFAKVEADKLTDEGVHINDYYRNNRAYELLSVVNNNLTKLGKKQHRITAQELANLYLETLEVLERADSLPSNISFLQPGAIDAMQAVNTIWAMDGKDLSSRIWTDKQKLQQSLMRHMGDFTVQGKSPWFIAQKMAKELESNIYNADRLVRTESAHIQNKAMIDKYRQLGYSNGIFLAAPSCCPHCQQMNGQRFLLKELEHILPAHPNCRCTFELSTD